MFKTLQNAVKVKFTLTPDGPILVRASNSGLDPGVAEMEFQRTRRNGVSTVFLAGSGLKGVLRSHAERLLRSQGIPVCDPTQKDNPCKSKKYLGTKGQPYEQCPACYTFGSLEMAGRFRVSDAFPAEKLWAEANQTEVRTQVGINRKSQGAKGGVLFDVEVVVGGGFEAEISGQNFSLWQLGVIFQVLDDLNEGLVQIGGCKSRGMGTVKVSLQEASFRFLNNQRGYLTGAKPVNEKWQYDLPADDEVPVEPGEGITETDRGLFRCIDYRGAAVTSLGLQLYLSLVSYVSQRGAHHG